jgi:hypothetical protein
MEQICVSPTYELRSALLLQQSRPVSNWKEEPNSLRVLPFCHDLGHYLRFPLLWGFFRVSVHPIGPRLAAPRWVEASCRWGGYDLGFRGEEFGSGPAVRTPPSNSDSK